ncbi:hypothetical protein BDW59DRAFT_179007 [Aspergillus cavernicola]|uniref:Aminoglycoside phosphotransferase domain-containing protein n=1 Tax=Aspergillus cavernicola TaxID=176166 RepID=A0ABR4IIW9_9EURO
MLEYRLYRHVHNFPPHSVVICFAVSDVCTLQNRSGRVTRMTLCSTVTFPTQSRSNAIIDLVHQVQDELWVDKVNKTHRTGHLCQWVSTFHPDKLPWMVGDEYADEKVTMEVIALRLIHSRTTIPVPKVHAWGPAASNTLSLSPFIMMDFIDGVSLSDLLQDPNAERPSRVMKEDISDIDIEVIYRQMANFQLQLFKLDFDRIGSLPWPEAQSTAPIRPLTFKAHSILQGGSLGDRNQGISSSLSAAKLNFGPYDARSKYVAFKVLNSLVPDLVNKDYERCKFKLICDDLGLANLIVRGREDITVVGVVDLEWSYIGPAQLFGSAPWWLLQDRPVNTAWDYDEEEEAKTPGYEERELSRLVKWSQSSGAMWLHMLSSGFNDEYIFPFMQLRQHFGTDEWAKHEKEFNNTEELEAFAEQKVSDLYQYNKAVEKIEVDKALVDSGRMTKEFLIALLDHIKL